MRAPRRRSQRGPDGDAGRRPEGQPRRPNRRGERSSAGRGQTAASRRLGGGDHLARRECSLRSGRGVSQGSISCRGTSPMAESRSPSSTDRSSRTSEARRCGFTTAGRAGENGSRELVRLSVATTPSPRARAFRPSTPRRTQHTNRARTPACARDRASLHIHFTSAAAVVKLKDLRIAAECLPRVRSLAWRSASVHPCLSL